MIWESHYWKEDLLRRAKDLVRRKDQRKWFDSSFANLEQNLMIGFYSVRKLIEARKISDSSVDKKIAVTKYPAKKSQPIHLLNWHDIDEHFDLENGSVTTVDIFYLCNQFVHSYVFIIELNENSRLEGFFVASDWQKNESLYFIDIEAVIGIFELVGNDYPSKEIYTFDSKKGDYQISKN